MKKFFNEFREFALQGNVMNLAVGVIIGAAFQGIVASLTADILSPIIGLFTRQNFDTLQVEFLGTTLRYGAFVTSVINFFIMAFVIFLLVRWMNRLMPKAPEPVADAAPTTKQCPYCRSEIDPLATRCPACTSSLEA
ncbi:MAG: large conductance mechanosensitive channel protein MscL [Clostridiales bacterium]|nr:large conductance mechanosensitive channel protein MscL [Clostridiales bacterium]